MVLVVVVVEVEVVVAAVVAADAVDAIVVAAVGLAVAEGAFEQACLAPFAEFADAVAGSVVAEPVAFEAAVVG